MSHAQTPHVRRSHPDTAPAQTAEGDTPGVYTPGTPGNGDRIDVGLQRILKRETRSSRAGMAALAAALVIAACLYALLESALRAIGQPPWLIDPQTAAERLTALPGGISPLLLGALGGVVAMVGLMFFLNAVLPGRKSRHLLEDPRAGVVVDDEVIASALARAARTAANVTQEQVMVVVSQRLVVVNVRPTSGVPLHEERILAAVEDELQRMAPSPMPSVRVNVAASGVIGA
ncbi:DUF6286 domain-containing protein [Arthrobacter bambusae]|jgi:hypothetical protein|uniref:Alkaline shock response membrane anchor protein AmaP n=1 Tax=Arthrobacter bambusae TaxID=1338426 RepID=A0AAW8DLU0_9MICC|nr:DUF6286 domain-containing protein [Arthrobacter bambusae]MDP9907396.1 hypothetical protein [Arthrobacter bambusae]MDQ0131528.1 hypothetical protein [Arthrobacter bambusae]MDQ0182940.1 hypothetical protein [Arthrobacter bambusae]